MSSEFFHTLFRGNDGEEGAGFLHTLFRWNDEKTGMIVDTGRDRYRVLSRSPARAPELAGNRAIPTAYPGTDIQAPKGTRWSEQSGLRRGHTEIVIEGDIPLGPDAGIMQRRQA